MLEKTLHLVILIRVKQKKTEKILALNLLELIKPEKCFTIIKCAEKSELLPKKSLIEKEKQDYLLLVIFIQKFSSDVFLIKHITS